MNLQLNKSPGCDWELHLSMPIRLSFHSSHKSKRHALKAAKAFALPGDSLTIVHTRNVK